MVKRLPNKLSITGHTDARPYATVRNYGNWELSADRANASRRELLIDGLPPERIEKVVGMAEHDPLVPEDPLSARNRRISIVLSARRGNRRRAPARGLTDRACRALARGRRRCSTGGGARCMTCSPEPWSSAGFLGQPC